MASKFRFRRSFGNVSSRFRGAIPKHFPLFTGLLDDFGGAAAAYSLRALSANWVAGDVVEVRRSSDSTSQDFTASQITNGELETFCGVGDGFVSIWYDQSGNANNATQATTTMQPKIVSAGALVVGGLDFDGVDDFLQSTSSTTHNSVFMVAARSSTTTATLFGSTLSNNRYSYLNTSGGSSLSFGTSGTLSYADNLNTAQHLFTALHSAGKMRKDGTQMASGAIGNNGGGDSLIGARHLAGVPATFWIGMISEIIVYPTDETTDVAAIDAAIIANYGI